MQLGALGGGSYITTRTYRDCTDAGGVVMGTTSGGNMPLIGTTSGSTRTVTMVKCFIPDQPAPAPAPAQITVSPQITTQVSPQVSPVFQQQFQPSGSPISANTASAPSMTTPAPQPVYAPTPAPAPQPVYAPAPTPAYVQPAASSVPVAAPTYTPPAVDTSPAESVAPPSAPLTYPTFNANASDITAAAPTGNETAAAKPTNWLLIAALAAGGLLLFGAKGDKHATR